MKNRSRRPPRPPRDPKVAARAIFNPCFVNFGSNLVPILSQKSMKKCVKNRLVFRSCFSSIFDRFLMPKIIPKSSENRSESAVVQKKRDTLILLTLPSLFNDFPCPGGSKTKEKSMKKPSKNQSKNQHHFLSIFSRFRLPKSIQKSIKIA